MASDENITVFDVVRAEKTEIELSDWQDGPISHQRFPLARRKLSLGMGFEWRIAKFNALGRTFRVLIALCAEKERYRAILAMETDNLLKVLCHHELHTNHFNWHCHLVRGNVDEVRSGVLRDNDTMFGWPKFSTSECTVDFDVDRQKAVDIAARRYRFERRQGGLL